MRSSPENTVLQRNFAVTYLKAAEVQEAQNNPSSALASYRSGLALAERIASEQFASPAEQGLLSIWYESVGRLQSAQGNRSDALHAFRSSASIIERLAATFPAEAAYRGHLLRDYGNIGIILFEEGDLDGALENLQRALIGTSPDDEELRHDISATHQMLGKVFRAKGDWQSAKRNFEIALAISDLLLTGPMTDKQAGDRSYLLECIGDASLSMGNYRDASETFRSSLAIVDILVATYPEMLNDQELLRNKLAKASAALSSG